KKLPDFNISEHIIGQNRNNGIVFDYKNKKACLILKEKGQLNYRAINFKDILSSEIIEDGESLQKTVRSSQIGGALIGGLALGGVGALIGGLSGKKKSIDKVKNIDVQIVINDTSNPIHLINCMNFNIGWEKKESGYKDGIDKARLLHAKIDTIIKQVDEEDKARVTNENRISSPNFISDEIKKLAELRDSGILSENEFQNQKQKLLNG
ncbi:MAG: SHOCT domain-containing protein, partial [Ignavibacteria bacterium]|nr:SHOCT domain-containing protein [Ignavibacteria bacterium]